MNRFYIIPNNKQIELLKEELILPLDGFSVGFDIYFTKEEIIEISKRSKVNVIINKFIHSKDLLELEKILKEIENYVNLFFIEDLGALSLVSKDKGVLFQSHIINNYESVNAFYNLNINKIVLNNDLTKDELLEIRNKTKSDLFIYSICKTNLMYSRRKLLSSYYDFNNTSGNTTRSITEKVSKMPLIIKEENSSTVIYNDELFSLNKYLDIFDNFNFIINLSSLTPIETQVVLNHYKDINLSDYIKINDYFLDNKIYYKVGDLK